MNIASRWCRRAGTPAWSAGAIPHSTAERSEILLSSRRLNRIRNIDAANYSITGRGWLRAGRPCRLRLPMRAGCFR
jgi:hypothetical protein